MNDFHLIAHGEEFDVDAFWRRRRFARTGVAAGGTAFGLDGNIVLALLTHNGGEVVDPD